MPDFELTPVDYDPFADSSNVVSGVPVQQAPGRLTINPQRGQAPPEPTQTFKGWDDPAWLDLAKRGYNWATTPSQPPTQPGPSFNEAVEHQQRWGGGSPPASQLNNIAGSVLANPITNIAQRGAEGPPQPPLSDDPAEMDRYQEVQKSYYGGNFMDVLGLAAPQMARAETGSAGVFGGKGAKTADLNFVASNDDLRYRDYSRVAALDKVISSGNVVPSIQNGRMIFAGLTPEENRAVNTMGWGRAPDVTKEMEKNPFTARRAWESNLRWWRYNAAPVEPSSATPKTPFERVPSGYPSVKLGALGSGEENAPESMVTRAAGDASADVRRRMNLIVARRFRDGTVKYGKPGDVHSSLLSEKEYWGGALDPDIDAKQMGFATEPGGQFMNRKQALRWAEQNEPQAAQYSKEAISRPGRPAEDFGLEASSFERGRLGQLGALGSGEESPEAMAAAPAGWISQRFPAAVNRTEDPLTQPLTIGGTELRQNPKYFDKLMEATRDYPNFAVEKERAAQSNMPEDSETQYRRLVDHAKDNLRFIYDNYKQFRDRSKLWYDGANRIATEQAKKYGMTTPQAAAVYAALSPQKDWFQNVSLGNRVMDIYHNEQNFQFTPQMMKTAKAIYRPTSKDPVKSAEQAKEAQSTIKRISSGPLSAMKNTDDKAAWIRAYDETYNQKHFPIVSPEGDMLETQMNKDGKTATRVAWGSIDQIGKAIDSIESGGDINKISALMGERHKIRNFYNNIMHPNADMGDVTIDTHAVAAALLRPLSGNSLEVGVHNFGKGSKITGTHGTYGVYADAYRELASDLGLRPRELQSITWEGVRGLFPEEFKTDANSKIIDQIWQRKDLSPAQKREDIRVKAGGFRPPDWHSD